MMVKAALRIEHTKHTKSPRVVLNASPLTDDPATEESHPQQEQGVLGRQHVPHFHVQLLHSSRVHSRDLHPRSRWRNFTFTFTVEPGGNGKETYVAGSGPGRLLGFLLKVYRIDLQVLAVLGSSDFCHDLGTRRRGRIA